VHGSVRKAWGWLGVLKAALKLSTGKRKLYLFTKDSNSAIAAYGWVNVGFCQHYEVAKRDVVIGPIWTASDSRGCGLATEGLKLTVREMQKRGFRRFYIDTRENNTPAIRAILNTGFEPVAAQFRGFDE
jgi:RimJ/RimL family protein N-acetyltransferase